MRSVALQHHIICRIGAVGAGDPAFADVYTSVFLMSLPWTTGTRVISRDTDPARKCSVWIVCYPSLRVRAVNLFPLRRMRNRSYKP